jgi:L-threonylcarbamoyladenylate synthase
MMDRHYAPRAELRLYHPSQQDQVRDWAARAAARGERVGVLLRTPVPGAHSTGAFDTGIARALVMPADPAGYARRLYAALHELDAAGCRVVYVELPPDAADWTGVRDRLRRGADGELGPA